ncbi:MAG: hypothetical protein K0B15_12310 [Lentimicrobium sp.]|nr:hypothetical protein [Lentimicrobium sp.]
MFNFFNNKKKENPISDVFKDLTTNQKMSITNFLLTIASSNQGSSDKQMRYLNNYVDILDVRGDDGMAYYKRYGLERIISDLKTLSKNQKEFLVVATWEMISSDGQPSSKQINSVTILFDKLGFSEEQFVEIIKKNILIMNHILGK